MTTTTEHSADGPGHLLYVAWGYPPARSAGMYRALATANSFAAAGWKVTVLTAPRETFEQLTGTDPESESAIDPRITVVRVPFDPARGETDLAKWSRTRIMSPLWWGFLKSFAERRSFPESVYGGWLRELLAAAERVHLASPVSLVIGSAIPNVDFAPGHRLRSRYGIPYVMDYRDAWHLDVYTGRTVGSRLSRSARLERRLLAKAAEVWFVNQPIRDWHAARHPRHADRFFVVANGYDTGFVGAPARRRPDPDSGLVFGYLGTIYGPMPLRASLEGWRLARSRSDLLARSRLVIRGRLGHYATPDAKALATIEEFADEGVSYGGPVSKTAVSAVYGGFDALLLALSSSPFITSGKVYEYVSTGLPIVSVHEPDTAAVSVLRDYPAWFPAEDLGAEAVARAFQAAAERATVTTPRDTIAIRDWAARYSRERQLAPRIAALSGGAE